MDFLTTFTQEASPRASGTDQERAAAEFLVEEFESIGLAAKLKPFKASVTASDVLVGPDAQEVRNFPMTLSGMGEASGLLVSVGKAFQDEIPPEGLEGKIAFIQRGDITFEEKVTRVTDAGARAAVIYNNLPGLFGGTLSNQAEIPAVAISLESGESILEQMAAGDLEATVSVVFEERDTQNVVADKPGEAGDERIIVLGGHYDTVPDVPGANDNGAGTATLITIAREVSDVTYPFTLRFIAFGSEELGLVGSTFYVESLSPEEREATVAMLNFDALATGDVVGVLGSFDLTTRVVEYGRQNGIATRRSFSLEGASSDHAPFQRAGIPFVFFLADDVSRIHTPEDTLEFVQPELMGNSAALGIALLDSLARP